MRSLGHVLGADGQHGVRFAKQNLLGAADQALKARATQAVDGQRGGFDRQADFETDVACEVGGIAARLHHIARENLPDIFGIEAALSERGLGGDHTEVGGGHKLEGAAHGPKRGTLRSENPNFAR